MEETLTLARVGIGNSLKRTLQSTNPIESMIESVRRKRDLTTRRASVHTRTVEEAATLATVS